jgi:cysteine desulfurase family protein (TIGR01976 family)
MSLDLTQIRSQFPALSRPDIYLDNPGGTQVARTSLERIQQYLVNANANHGGSFATSRASDALVEQARAAAADFLCAARSEEIVFGPNMTSLTFNISRALARTFNPGDTIVVTRLDHDANVSPWLLAAEDRGCRIRWVDFHPEDGTLDLDDLRAALAEKPRLLAVGYASNALGTVNPVAEIVRWAHEAGALVYIDAVQYAPHGPIDVQKLDCDFLVCSAYKFFGPHAGVLYGKYALLESLAAYRVRPAPALPPGKFETGTGNFEAMCGTLGALEYLEGVGQIFGEDPDGSLAARYTGRQLTFKRAMTAIQAYEVELSKAILDVLAETPGVTIYGITDPQRFAWRVPTFSFRLAGTAPLEVAQWVGERGINIWDGNFYALSVTQRLGLEGIGGLVRVGATHYNTLAEVQAFGRALHDLARRQAALRQIDQDRKVAPGTSRKE